MTVPTGWFANNYEPPTVPIPRDLPACTHPGCIRETPLARPPAPKSCDPMHNRRGERIVRGAR